MNVDVSEIEKFSSLASTWWDKNGAFWTLHAINPLRMGFIQEHLSLPGLQILDVGCGGGILSESLAKAGATVTGIDLSEPALKVAQIHLMESQLHVNYECVSAEVFAEQNPSHFDCITCMEMLEHVPDPESILRACSTLLKPGGYLFVSTLNRNLKSFLMAIVGAEYILNLIPKGTHDYEKFIRPAELIQSARKLNLEPQRSTGIHYNPLTRSFRLGENTDVNYIVCFQKQ